MAPFATTSGKTVKLCPECKGHGYDAAEMFYHGGLRRPCGTCLLVGFVYTDGGEPLTEVDAISVMRQSMTRMIAISDKLSKEVKKLEARIPAPSLADQIYPDNERGPGRSKYCGD
ncbi:hypothetical protein E1189_10015 [Sansalvadorimonas verongulae]|nr:hypothetical protein [Sansalvadorimonas verongulae]